MLPPLACSVVVVSQPNKLKLELQPTQPAIARQFQLHPEAADLFLRLNPNRCSVNTVKDKLSALLISLCVSTFIQQ